MDILGLDLQSVNEVSIQGMKNGVEIVKSFNKEVRELK